MTKYIFCAGMLVVLAGTAGGVIARLTPLRQVLQTEQFIFVVQVDSLDRLKPAVALKVVENLKGRPPFQQLLIDLTGDPSARQEKQTEQLLKRLVEKQSLVVFTTERNSRYTAFAYAEGTWFQLVGQAGANRFPLHWSFTHVEPYLRRTYKGTTAELRQVVIDGLSGRKAPPEPDPKEPPGLGPEPKEPCCKGQVEAGGPLFAVIPSFVLIGPLAVLAALFPALFGGLAIKLRRWLVLLSAASLCSLLWFLYAWLRIQMLDTIFDSEPGLWVLLASVCVVASGWSLHRSRMVVTGSQRLDTLVLGALSLGGLCFAAYLGARGHISRTPWLPLLPASVAVWTGWLCLISCDRLRLPPEPIMLLVAGVAFVGLAGLRLPLFRLGVEGSLHQDWVFEPSQPGSIVSSPVVMNDRVFLGVAHNSGFSTFGALYCLDRATGRLVWQYNDAGRMKQIFSTPCFAEGRLFVGEGFHEDRDCRLHALNAATGQKLWDFPTTSHVESSPCVAGQFVYFGAGEDGVYCLDTSSGRKVWQSSGWHVDTSPAIVGNRLYVGSGYGTTEVGCLDATTGRSIWRIPVGLPAFAGPVVAGERVFFALGNGNLFHGADQPAGAILCLDRLTGKRIWRFDTPDAVHGRPVCAAHLLQFSCRNGNVYCLDQQDGSLAWRALLGGEIVAAPVRAGSNLYALRSDGLVHCYDVDTGATHWSFEVGRHASAQPRLWAAPALVDGKEGRELLLAISLDYPIRCTARLCHLHERASK